MLYGRTRRVDVFDQAVPVEVQPRVHDRNDRGQPDRTAEIAGQIVEPGGVSHPVGRQTAHCDHVGRQVAADQPHPAYYLRQEQFPEPGLVGQRGRQIHRIGEQAEADRQHDPQIQQARHAGTERRQHHGDEADDNNRAADLPGIVAAHLRQKERHQISRAVHPDAHREGKERSECEIAVPKRAQIHDRLVIGEDAPEEQAAGND